MPAQATEVLTNPAPSNVAYFSVALSNAGVFNGTYLDWCVDTTHTINPGSSYTVDLYSTAGTIPAGLVSMPQNFPEVVNINKKK